MTKPYKIGIGDLDRTGGVERLERDGFRRDEIMAAVHKHTDECSPVKGRQEQRELVNKLFEREGE